MVSLLYCTQNLFDESLSPDCSVGLEFDFDPLRVGLVDGLPNHASYGGFLFLGGESLFFNSDSRQHSMVDLPRAHQDALAWVTAAGGRAAAIVAIDDRAVLNSVGAQNPAASTAANQPSK